MAHLKKSWDDVKPSTVISWFKKAQFIIRLNQILTQNEGDDKEVNESIDIGNDSDNDDKHCPRY